jgi:hypothetical protein
MRYLLAFAFIALAGCSGGHHRSLLETVREANAVTPAPERPETPLVAVDLHGRVFQIRPRESELEKFPCQRCHKVPLAQMKHDGKDGKPRAHWNLQLKHAGESVMNCSTCHDPNDMNVLKTVTGKRVSIDESWQVCAQCHSRQAADWAGGAHGKRAAGWASTRVAKTCAECHNPHRPAWDTRAPVHVALTGVAGEKDGR